MKIISDNKGWQTGRKRDDNQGKTDLNMQVILNNTLIAAYLEPPCNEMSLTPLPGLHSSEVTLLLLTIFIFS